MKCRVPWVVGVALLGLLATGCGSSTERHVTATIAAPTRHPTATPAAPWLAPPNMDEILESAREAAAAQRSFAGNWGSPDPAEIYVATTDAAAMSTVMDPFRQQGALVHVVQARYTEEELSALNDRVKSDLEAGAFADIDLVGFGIHAPCNCVVMAVFNLTYEQRVAVLARYGPMLAVEEQEPMRNNAAATRSEPAAPGPFSGQ